LIADPDLLKTGANTLGITGKHPNTDYTRRRGIAHKQVLSVVFPVTLAKKARAGILDVATHLCT